MKKINCIVLGLVSVALILLSGVVLAEKPQTGELSRAVLKINGLSCGACFSTINSGLTPLEGYSGMGANLFRKLIAIDFVPPLTSEKIIQTLSDAGYPGTLETIDPISTKESFAYLESRRTRAPASGGSCCRGRGYPPGTGRASQKPFKTIPAPSGSCCSISGSAQPTQDL